MPVVVPLFISLSVCVGLLAASPEIRAGNWKDGFPKVYHALDDLLVSGEGQAKAGGWGGSSKVDGVGVGCTIVTALLDRKRGQASTNAFTLVRLLSRAYCKVFSFFGMS